MIEKNKAYYISQLTFLKFIAAIVVVICHFGKDVPPFNLPFIKDLVDQGAFIVSFFFFLSGVVLGLNYWENLKVNAIGFYKKRVTRIYPLYLTMFVTSLILTMLYNGSFPKGSSIILQLLSLHAWSPGMCLEINFPTWSISVEVFFYVLFPFIHSLLKIRSNLMITIIVLLIWILSIAQHYYFSNYLNYPDKIENRGQFILYFPLWHLNTFLFGILCSIAIIKKIDPKKLSTAFHNTLILIALISIIVILSTDNFIKPLAHNGVLSPLFFLLIIGLSNNKTLIARLFSNKNLVLLGDSSYAVYIMQWSIYLVFTKMIGVDLTEFSFYIFLVILIFISILTHLYFEKRIKHILFRKRKTTLLK